MAIIWITLIYISLATDIKKNACDIKHTPPEFELVSVRTAPECVHPSHAHETLFFTPLLPFFFNCNRAGRPESPANFHCGSAHTRTLSLTHALLLARCALVDCTRSHCTYEASEQKLPTPQFDSLPVVRLLPQKWREREREREGRESHVAPCWKNGR